MYRFSRAVPSFAIAHRFLIEHLNIKGIEAG